MLLIFMTKTYRPPDCEKVGDYEEDVDCYRKDQQRLRFLTNTYDYTFFGLRISESFWNLYENIPWVNV